MTKIMNSPCNGLKLNPIRKAKWLLELRSSAYIQGKGYLRGKEGSEDAPWTYCCLGVWCDMFAPMEWEPPEVHMRNVHHDARNLVVAVFDNAVMPWNGSKGIMTARDAEGMEMFLPDTRPDEPISRETRVLEMLEQFAWLNDHGYSFADIADWIEEHL